MMCCYCLSEDRDTGVRLENVHYSTSEYFKMSLFLSYSETLSENTHQNCFTNNQMKNRYPTASGLLYTETSIHSNF